MAQNKRTITGQVASKLPSPPEYQQVIQHPEICFEHPQLIKCSVESDPLGLPRPRSGGFVLTYKLMNQNEYYAVRCFHKPNPEREFRYKIICDYLDPPPSDIFIPIYYLSKGIRVKQNWYPITYMPWVEGDTLSTFIDKNSRNPNLINLLPNEFLRIVNELEKLKIAHGDLSDANIIVQPSLKMKLIDYDGIFLPKFAGLESHEIGNINFQHYLREPSDFDENLDRFSTIVIYLSLQAISHNPILWLTYGPGEGLILTKKDFLAPDQSQVLSEITRLPKLKSYIDLFKKICLTDLSHVPRLEDFLHGKVSEIPISIVRKPTQAHFSQYPVLDAKDYQKILQAEGQMVEIVGKVMYKHQDKASRGRKKGSPFIFFNFGDYWSGCFTLVLWSEVLDLYKMEKKNPQELLGKWVSITGLITSYNSRPQIVLESPKQVEILTGKNEAEQRLHGKDLTTSIKLTREKEKATSPIIAPIAPPQVSTPPIPSQSPPSASVTWPSANTSKELDKLYNKSPKSSQPKQTSKPSVAPIPKPTTRITPKPSTVSSSTRRQKQSTKSPQQSTTMGQPKNFQAKIDKLFQGQGLTTGVGARRKQNFQRIALFLLIIGIIIVLFLVIGVIDRYSKPAVYIPLMKTQITVVVFITETPEPTPKKVKTEPPVITPSPLANTNPVEIDQTQNEILGCLSGNLKIRTGPGTDFPTEGYVLQDTCLSFDGRSSDNQWLHIYSEDDPEPGWIYNKWLTLSGDIEELPILD